MFLLMILILNRDQSFEAFRFRYSDQNCPGCSHWYHSLNHELLCCLLLRKIGRPSIYTAVVLLLFVCYFSARQRHFGNSLPAKKSPFNCHTLRLYNNNMYPNDRGLQLFKKNEHAILNKYTYNSCTIAYTKEYIVI